MKFSDVEDSIFAANTAAFISDSSCPPYHRRKPWSHLQLVHALTYGQMLEPVVGHGPRAGPGKLLMTSHCLL